MAFRVYTWKGERSEAKSFIQHHSRDAVNLLTWGVLARLWVRFPHSPMHIERIVVNIRAEWAAPIAADMDIRRTESWNFIISRSVPNIHRLNSPHSYEETV